MILLLVHYSINVAGESQELEKIVSTTIDLFGDRGERNYSPQLLDRWTTPPGWNKVVQSFRVMLVAASTSGACYLDSVERAMHVRTGTSAHKKPINNWTRRLVVGNASKNPKPFLVPTINNKNNMTRLCHMISAVAYQLRRHKDALLILIEEKIN